ncbi:hypothetical protein BT96DRAFT_403700 [Gymnopus androsaceus JB14]|uniref:FHA domain-containing protein n=1 Tax=Gymnopus androsaceus JB14 TaxID=1447944 RepID=A0A6A4I2S7_9AGAR|nr:hypothetical protein BT96DRAFT_403700 [Gymnopus androsaceus JB14]
MTSPATKEKKKSPQEIIESVELICEDPPHSKAKPRKFTVKKDSSNEFSIGCKLFGTVRGKSVSLNHATLSFKGKELYITDSGSRNGTWIRSIGALVSGKAYLLEDGKTVVFGAKEDKTDKTPDAIRVKLKIIRSKPKPKPILKPTVKVAFPDDDTLQVPRNPRPRAVTPDTLSLKPPEPTSKHRRTVSWEIPSNKERAPSASVQPKKPVATTELQRQVKIPWSKTFRLGFGVDALTGEFTTRDALTPFKMTGSPRHNEGMTYIDTLHWNGIMSLEDQYDVEIGGTINIPPAAVSMNTRISSLLAKKSSVTTVLIQYRVIGEFEPEFIPSNVALKDGLAKLSDDVFRREYGDYYLAGLQRGYGVRMVIVCQIESKTVTEKLEVEAKTLVENFFKAGAGHSNSETRSKNCSMMHVMIETYGCSPNAAHLSKGLLSPTDALAALPKILEKPKGTPRIGILYHYRCAFSLFSFNPI